MNFMTPEEYILASDPVTSEAEAFEERAAILEFQAGHDRATAEAMAAPIARKFCQTMNLYALRTQAAAIAARRRKR